MPARVICGKKAYLSLAMQQVAAAQLRRLSNPIQRLMSTSSREPEFPGIESRFTKELKFLDRTDYHSIPVYSIIGGNVSETSLPKDCQLEEVTLKNMYKKMVTLNTMDKILYESQRQGRISFYMTNTGEEAIQIGSAAALTLADTIYAQYREAGVLLWRGYSISQFMNQCYGNCKDSGKGRQMPVHYGSKELNFMTISSPLTTQLPQAVGAAYALKRAKKEACVVCYFGEGAASEGDAHAAFNFAATLDCPVIFMCRNNGYAISTPTHQQFKGDGIAARGPAYGIRTIRINGNDVLAVYHATKVAREISVKEKRPVLIEAMTYRIGHHSTSDDSTAYRSIEEINQWNKESPTKKFRSYLESIGLWSNQQEKELVESAKKEILTEFAKAEKELKPSWNELFSDVYHSMPEHIRKQMSTMEQHVKQYPSQYPLKSFEPTG